MALEQVARPGSLAELAYDQLRTAVLDGHFHPGEKVSVVTLAAELGMSRSPVRAALERLVNEGLIRLTAGGALIAEPTRDELLDALVVRSALEGLAARLAAPLLKQADLDQLRAIHDRLDRAVQAGDTGAVRAADLEFHQQVQAHSGNACLVENLTRIQSKIMIATYSTPWGPHLDDMLSEHAAILRALEAGDPESAHEAATHHLANHLERLKVAWQRAPEDSLAASG
jgi:DNA-binding GntR family transcriptional regulator